MVESFIGSLGPGAFWFGVVVGYLAYRTIKHVANPTVSDFVALIGAIGGGAVVKLFAPESVRFDQYAFGLAFGFFIYLVLSVGIGLWRGGQAADQILGPH